MFFKRANSVEKQPLNFRNASAFGIIWVCLITDVWKTTKNTCSNFKKELFSPLSNPKESPLTLMHLWHLSTIPSFWVECFAKCLLKGVFWNMFFFSKFKIPFLTFVIRQTQIIPNDSQLRILETAWHRSISEIWQLFFYWICRLKKTRTSPKNYYNFTWMHPHLLNDKPNKTNRNTEI